MKKKITIITCAVMALMLMLAGCGKKTEKVEKVTPTLMYFVSNADTTFDAENAAFEELKSEYGDKVNFTLVNVDENPEALENFAMVKDNTPFAIMLNTKNDISGLSPKTAEKDKLKEIIDKAVNE